MLDHEQVEQYLSAYRELSGEEKVAVEAHLAICQDCARLAEEYRQVDRLLKNSNWKQPDPHMAADFYEMIEKDGRSWFQSFKRFGGQFAGVAVLFLVVVSTWLLFRSGLNQTPDELPTVTVASTTVPTATPKPAEALVSKYTLTQTVGIFALSPEGSYLATAENNQIQIWEATSGKLLNTLNKDPFIIESMAFTPNGVNLIARDTNGQFHRWLAFNGAYQRTFSGAESKTGTPYVLGNTTLALVAAENNVQLWPLLGSQPKAKLKSNGEPIMSLEITPDGQTIAAQLQNGIISLWNQYGDPAGAFSPTQQNIRGMALSDNGKKIATFSENTVYLWQDYNFNFELSSEPSPGTISGVRFISDDTSLMVAFDQGYIEIWDANSGELIKTFESDPAVQSAIGLTRNGFLYATLDSQGAFTIWEKPDEGN